MKTNIGTVDNYTLYVRLCNRMKVKPINPISEGPYGKDWKKHDQKLIEQTKLAMRAHPSKK